MSLRNISTAITQPPICRHFHSTDKSSTRHFILYNQATFWALHILAWFAYSMLIYSLHNEEAGILRITPLILAFVSFGPFLGALHWANSVNPSYKAGDARRKSRREQVEGRVAKKYLFYAWQIATIITRLTSMALLCFVFFEHWFEVGDAFKVALLMMIPFVLLVLVVNVGLQFASFGSPAMGSALLASFLPNGFRATSISRAGRYIVLNMSLNLILHLVLWLTMTFYCWECTKVLDVYFRKLSICFPIAVSFWLANLVLTLVTWRLSVRNSVEGDPAQKEAYRNYRESKAAWAEKGNSVTTKF